MIYETADPKMVIVEIAPEEVQLVYHGESVDLLLSRKALERQKLALVSAGIYDDDIIGSGFDITEEERNAVLAAAVYYKLVPVRRARAPRRKICR